MKWSFFFIPDLDVHSRENGKNRGILPAYLSNMASFLIMEGAVGLV
jgi:hypothetical protein